MKTQMNILERNNVHVQGNDGPVLLYAHGFGCNQAMWDRITPAFSATHRQVLFDYVGSGKSDLASFDAKRYSSLQGYTQDVLDVCDALNLRSGVTYIGHSVSASVGLLASIARPELFDRLVLIGPTPCFLNHSPDYLGGFEREDLLDLLSLMDQNYIGWANYLAPVIAGEAETGTLSRELSDSFCSTDPLVTRIFAQTTFFADNRADLPQVSRPSLILQHRHDALVPLAVGDYLHSHLQGSTLKVLDVAGHCGHMSHPSLVVEAIREYLDLCCMNDLLNQLPCPTLISDKSGYVLAVNTDLLALVGGSFDHWLHKPMENFFPPASRIFLQTHVWPMLLSEGNVREIYLKISDVQNQRIPVIMNCRRGLFSGVDSYFWVFFVALERSKFEVELLDARNRAELSALALAERESFVKNVTDAMPGLVAYWDKDLRCHFANKTYLEWFGKLPEAIIGTTLQDLLGERLFTLNESYIQGVLSGESQVFESTLTKADGSISFTLANYIPDFDALGAVVGFFVLVSDVTTIKTAELELRLAASVFECTVEGIMVTDDQGIILSVNPAFSRITGYSAEEAIGQTPRLLKSNRHDKGFYAVLWQTIANEGCWEGETWNRRKDGEVFLEWQSITVIHGATYEPVRYVSVFNDITEFWQKDERMRHLAFHDSLTDLPNRTLLMERLDHLLAITEREQRNIAVLFLDLDGFKAVNDKLGHDIGDDLLKSVAKKLLTQVRQLDTVARLGGDEFIILLDNPENNDEVAGIATRIVTAINVPMELRGKLASVGVSIGIAMHPFHGQTTTELMKNADTAMYVAKKAGKNTYRFFVL